MLTIKFWAGHEGFADEGDRLASAGAAVLPRSAARLLLKHDGADCFQTRWRYANAIICKARFDPPARKIAMGIKDARKVTGPSQVGPRVASAGRRYPAFRPAAASSFGPLSLG
jgi:hypothetical protein